MGQRIYRINHNVHLAAFGKAALDMVRGAEDALEGHITEGLASVPRGTLQKLYVLTEFNFTSCQMIDRRKETCGLWRNSNQI